MVAPLEQVSFHPETVLDEAKKTCIKAEGKENEVWETF